MTYQNALKAFLFFITFSLSAYLHAESSVYKNEINTCGEQKFNWPEAKLAIEKYYISPLNRSELGDLLENGPIVLTQSQAPKTMTMIERCAKLLKIETPLILISRTKTIFAGFAGRRGLITGEYRMKNPLLQNGCAQKINGKYVITLGMQLVNAHSDEELETVIAHEMSHIALDHCDKWYNQDEGILLIKSLLITGCGMASALLIDELQGDGFLSQKTAEKLAMASVAPGIVTLLTPLLFMYKPTIHRDHEKQADLLALRITQNPEAMISSLTKWPTEQTAIGWFDSHPSSEERITYIRAEAQKMGLEIQ